MQQLVMTSNQLGNHVQMSKWETMKIKNPWKQKFPESALNPKNTTSREKQEHEDSGHAVYRSWCAACVEGRNVGGQHRIELLEGEERERATPNVVRFLDKGKRRHVSKSDLSRQHGMVKRERRVVNGKVPQQTPFHFLLVSSKILVFAESF